MKRLLSMLDSYLWNLVSTLRFFKSSHIARPRVNFMCISSIARVCRESSIWASSSMALLNRVCFSGDKESVKESRLDRSVRYCRRAGVCSSDIFIREICSKVLLSSFNLALAWSAEYSPRCSGDDSAEYVLTILTW